MSGRDDLDPGDGIGEPTDQWIADLIRRVRKIPVGEPISASLIRKVRSELRALARRRLVARREHREPLAASAADVAPDAREDVREVLLDLVRSPHGQVGIWMLIGAPIFLHAAVDAVAQARAMRLFPRHECAPIRDYLAGKLGGRPWPARQGSRRPFTVAGGHRVHARTPRERGPSPLHIAACNAVTVGRAREWLSRLDEGSDADRRAVLVELDEIGIAASEASAPLPLWYTEEGPPRGLWPDPPPPEDDGAAGLKTLVGGLLGATVTPKGGT